MTPHDDHVWYEATVEFENGNSVIFARVRPNESMPVWCLARILTNKQPQKTNWTAWLVMPELKSNDTGPIQAQVCFPALEVSVDSLESGTLFVLVRGNIVLARCEVTGRITNGDVKL